MKKIVLLLLAVFVYPVQAQDVASLPLWKGDVRVVGMFPGWGHAQLVDVVLDNGKTEQWFFPAIYQDSLQLRVGDIMCSAVNNPSKLIGEFTAEKLEKHEYFSVVIVNTSQGEKKFVVNSWCFVNNPDVELNTDIALVRGEVFRLVEFIDPRTDEKRLAVLKQY